MHAVRDNNLFQKLCDALRNILGNHPLTEDGRNYLTKNFLPQIQVDERGQEDPDWDKNPNKSQSRTLLDRGFFTSTSKCLWEYCGSRFSTQKASAVEGSRSAVDYVGQVDREDKVLVEAKCPRVISRAGALLPQHGIELAWVSRRPLVEKILSRAALELGQRRMEWLFLTCHNYWIVCRLVRDDNRPFLAYSQKISIEDSSVPFRAFLGALLSVVKDVPVERSEFTPGMQLDIISEDEEPGVLPEHDLDSGSKYPGSSNDKIPVDPLKTYDHRKKTSSELMVTSSSPHSLESFQIWMHLYSSSNNTLLLPQSATDGKRVWLTHFIASGSTGDVWQCRFDDSDHSFAVKIVEVLRRGDGDRRQRLRNEFNVYLTLEKMYQSGQLHDRIAPQCYGAFRSRTVNIIILDLHEGVLNSWDELSASERDQIFALVNQLHLIGIVHRDLEPRNVTRIPGGGYRLIDFTESRKHICREHQTDLPTTSAQKCQKCPELQTLRQTLWERKPL